MDTTLGQLVAALVTIISPYMPYLIEVGKDAGKKLADVISEKGGEAAWEKAQTLWSKLETRFGGDAEVQSATTLVAAKPGDSTRQTMLAEVLGERLQAEPAFAQELFQLLGGYDAVQQVLADQSSWVEDVTQQLKGAGTQTIKASNDSVIKGVRQVKQ